EELYKRLGYANYNIQSKKLYTTKKPTAKKSSKSNKKLTRYCSMYGKAGHTKMNCSKFKKAKKINNINSFQYIDQSQSEDDIYYINNESTQKKSSQEESDQK